MKFSNSHNSHNSQLGTQHVIDVSWSERWQVYQRLNELDIPCHCQSNQPLQVEITNPQIAIQVWSVVRQVKAYRQDLICHLKDCLRLRYQAL
ncbi:MAG: Asr1405/Asl0597 family protein [Sphaerospermopsis kisseleviana]|uniref:Asr1405/Asl0597 family protein n=1 Tax=Sphaerospermopsis sp. LEGE 00249 TaxID=1380707 RepID=UPI00164D277C|nr:Asr1405/Asl0597 family protein [Sphaerospermopsis sp. LEGE 00249]MBC5794428.1 hypothetical protein [Sphaerospermopsis sp. LEGE 00249]